jgi:tetratricopeptide (TPR) repeat protein
MDCRYAILGVGVLGSVLGCVPPTAIPLVESGQQPVVSERKEPDPATFTPKASTCVAFGAFSERCAADEIKYNQVERDRLYDQARKAYQQALQVEPANLQALTALARLYANRGEHDRAVATYQKAVAAHPKQVELHYELGMCCARKKEWNSAVQSLQKAVALDPENRACNRSLGLCLARAGRIDESFAVLAEVDGEAGAHYTVARMLHHMNQDIPCKEHLLMALQLRPDLAPAKQLLDSLEANSTASGARPIQPEMKGDDTSVTRPE